MMRSNLRTDKFVLLTSLREGQEAVVLQLPAQPMTASEAEFRSGPPSLVKQKWGFATRR